ncbi:amino acid permease [Candidatus Woesearchaeota archaeon]|nr:amino acid permease [Candidatus Woesearchaeota archaeon]
MFHKRGSPNSFLAKHPVGVASLTLIGGIVGAGVLGIPYTIAKAGLLYGLVLVIGLGLLFLTINLFLGEVILRTKESHQLVGYADKYLGFPGRFVITCTMIINVYGALIAYLLGTSTALSHIFPFGSPFVFMLIFFGIASTIVIFGLKTTSRMETIIVGLMLLTIIIMGIASWQDIHSDHFETFHPAFFFLPYGVILFAYHGLLIVPEAAQQLRQHKKSLRKAIIIGSCVPIVIYALFSIIVVGLVGPENFSLLEPNERIATVALSIYAHPIIGFIVNILAVLAMFSSYLALGTALLEMYKLDYKLKTVWAVLLTFSIPFVVVYFSLTTFITVLGIVGAVVGGIDSSTIVLMYWRAKKYGERKPEYSLSSNHLLGAICILFFAAGIGYFFLF